MANAIAIGQLLVAILQFEEDEEYEEMNMMRVQRLHLRDASNPFEIPEARSSSNSIDFQLNSLLMKLCLGWPLTLNLAEQTLLPYLRISLYVFIFAIPIIHQSNSTFL